ncbi:MAG: hypothetical protein JEY97_12965 [Bacteroidales bacterium]|nr:hypothetical protein [Bacteroidales bacterium]
MKYKRVSLIISLLLLYVFDLYAIDDKLFQTDERIIVQEGLSQSRILSIIEDNRGFMWFGTSDGLNRYDGYRFKIYRNIFGDSTSIQNNTINSMVESDNGIIWIGTNNGLSMFNPYTEVFTSLKESDSIPIAYGANIIKSCVIDKNRDIWYSTHGFGIFKLNHKTLKKEKLLLHKAFSKQLKDVDCLFIDSFNRLWFGGFTDTIVLSFNINNDRVEKFPIQGIDEANRNSLKITSFFEDNERVWINLIDYDEKNGGLFFLNKSKEYFNNYRQFISKKYYDVFFDSFNSITGITGDNEGNIWFASLLSGIFKFKFGHDPTAYYIDSYLEDSRINCIYRSSNGILWIGTNGNGIEISISDNTDFKLMNSKINSDFSVESIRAFAEDKDFYFVGGYYGISKIKKDFSSVNTFHKSSVYSFVNCIYDSSLIWTGSEGGGLRILDKKDNILTSVEFKDNEVNQHLLEYIFVIYSYNDTLLLLGTKTGLTGFNPFSKNITPYPYLNSTINDRTHKTVRTIYKDNHGNILIGYDHGGIGKFDLNEKRVEKFDIISDLKDFNNFNPVNCIYNDKGNKYWIATSNGLIEYNSTENNFKLFTEADGLPNSHIYGILPDEEDNLWLSTNSGISCYHQKEGIFRNYDVSDGLQNNEFNTGAYFKSSNDTLFFGGINGFNYFNPQKIKQNSIIPKLIITGIKIANQSVNINKNVFSDHKLIIQPNQEVFTIEFAGLSFINSAKNQYKYKIRELNQDWIYIGNQHQIAFNNMSAGTYTLEILASNNHGLWLKEPYIFTIVVLPTFFESLYFKWIIAVLIILFVFAGYKLRLRQLTKQKFKLQKFADRQTASLLDANKTLKHEIIKHQQTTEELNATNKTKDKFLSIIAHDIINPLGVILGFSDLLIDKDNEFDEKENRSFVKIINLTAKELTMLLSNLLEWSRLQNDTIKPNPKTIILKDIVAETVTLLQGNIVNKEINLLENIEKETQLWADKNMLSTILRNLLSNAIKFTPEKGKIIINAKHIDKKVEVSISDTGIGIPEANLKKLFDPDNNISTKGTDNESGTGLGLSLVHEFVSINKGKIWVSSEVGKGSTFYFTLPAN